MASFLYRLEDEHGEPADPPTMKAAVSDWKAGDPIHFLANPVLLEGAWTANAPRLSELIADYRLIADLATVYGRIEELR